MVNGFPIQDTFTPYSGTWNHPTGCYNTISNFVSNGHIVGFAQYNWTAVPRLVPGSRERPLMVRRG